MSDSDYLLDMQLEAFQRLSSFLNETPDAITGSLVKRLQQQLGCGPKYAYTLLLAAACGLDTVSNAMHKDMFRMVVEPAVHLLDVREYQENAYYRTIRFGSQKYKGWELCRQRYKPFEAFVCNDIEVTPDGLQVPQIGFFAEQFDFPAVLEDGRIWMTVTPNEVETMNEAVAQAHGKVLAYGLGLGYFPFMVSLKTEVTSVTVVEKDISIIELFGKQILPQFPAKDKITVVCDDAFRYAGTRMGQKRFDFVFTDLWHDVSDGLPMYRQMKRYESLSPHSQFAYWIEKSIRCYL